MKKFRKLGCLAMAAVTMLSMSVSASAESYIGDDVMQTEAVVTAEPDDEGYVLIGEETFINEDGVTVTHKSYIKDSGISTCGTASKGEADIKEEEEYKVGVTPWVTLWVEGHFKWDSAANTSTVTLLDHGHVKHAGGVKIIKNDPPTTGNNQGGHWGGKKYSYIDKRITMKGGATVGMSGDENTFRLWVDVNVNGEKSLHPNDPAFM